MPMSANLNTPNFADKICSSVTARLVPPLKVLARVKSNTLGVRVDALTPCRSSFHPVDVGIYSIASRAPRPTITGCQIIATNPIKVCG